MTNFGFLSAEFVTQHKEESSCSDHRQDNEHQPTEQRDDADYFKEEGTECQGTEVCPVVVCVELGAFVQDPTANQVAEYNFGAVIDYQSEDSEDTCESKPAETDQLAGEDAEGEQAAEEDYQGQGQEEDDHCWDVEQEGE